MAALDADKSSAAGAGDNSEELILELFDVLERCPAAARDAATDAALEAIAAAAAPEEPEEQVPEAVKSEPSSAAEAVLQTIDYDALLNSTDEKAVEAAVASAFGPNGFGVLAVTNVPAALTAKRRRLLRLGQKLGTLPDDVLKQYERPELCYCAGWSRGREKFRGQLDVAKGSWYANGLHSHIDDASLRERYPESTTEPQWPSPELLGDSLEDAFRDLSRDLHALSRHVLRRCDAVAERALRKRGVAYETTLSEVVDRSRLHVGRLLHYFPRDASGTWCGWHNDNSIITALAPALFYDAAGSEVPRRRAPASPRCRGPAPSTASRRRAGPCCSRSARRPRSSRPGRSWRRPRRPGRRTRVVLPGGLRALRRAGLGRAPGRAAGLRARRRARGLRRDDPRRSRGCPACPSRSPSSSPTA